MAQDQGDTTEEYDELSIDVAAAIKEQLNNAMPQHYFTTIVNTGEWLGKASRLSEVCEVIYEMFYILKCGFEIK